MDNLEAGIAPLNGLVNGLVTDVVHIIFSILNTVMLYNIKHQHVHIPIIDKALDDNKGIHLSLQKIGATMFLPSHMH